MSCAGTGNPSCLTVFLWLPDPKCSAFAYRKADHACLTTKGDKLSEKADWSYYSKKAMAPTLSALSLPKTKLNHTRALRIGHENKTSDGVVADPSALKATESEADAVVIEKQIKSYVAKTSTEEPVAMQSPKILTY